MRVRRAGDYYPLWWDRQFGFIEPDEFTETDLARVLLRGVSTPWPTEPHRYGEYPEDILAYAVDHIEFSPRLAALADELRAAAKWRLRMPARNQTTTELEAERDRLLVEREALQKQVRLLRAEAALIDRALQEKAKAS